MKKLNERESLLKEEQGRLSDQLAHVPDTQSVKEFIERVSKSGKLLHYVNPRFKAKMDHAAAFESMTPEDKKALCKAVFSGKTADGKRNGVKIEVAGRGELGLSAGRPAWSALLDAELAVTRFAKRSQH